MRRSAFLLALISAATFASASGEPGLRATAKSSTSSEWKVSGQLYGYYQYAFGDPGAGETILGRKYDNRHDQIRLSNAKLKFVREADSKLPFTVRGMIWAGDDSDFSFKGETTGSTLVEHVRVLEISAPVRNLNQGELAIGRFDLPMGYESGDTDKTVFFGTGMLRTLILPTYGTGARLSFMPQDHTMVNLYVVNGWNEVVNPNARPGYAVTAKAKLGEFNGGLGVYAGSEGAARRNNGGTFGGAKFANAGGTNLTVLDGFLSTKVGPRTELAFEAGYRIQGDPNERKTLVNSLFAVYNLGRGWEAGVRGELANFYVDDDQVERRYALTASVSRRFGNGHRLMLELRRDTSNDPVFADSNGATDQQSTITLAYGLKF